LASINNGKPVTFRVSVSEYPENQTIRADRLRSEAEWGKTDLPAGGVWMDKTVIGRK
jgi:hypothetical protein